MLGTPAWAPLLLIVAFVISRVVRFFLQISCLYPLTSCRGVQTCDESDPAHALVSHNSALVGKAMPRCRGAGSAQLKVLKEQQERRQEVMTLAALKMGAQRMKGLQRSKDALNKQAIPRTLRLPQQHCGTAPVCASQLRLDKLRSWLDGSQEPCENTITGPVLRMVLRVETALPGPCLVPVRS